MDADGDNVDADRIFRYEGQDEFSSVLAQTTLLRAFSEPKAAPEDPWDWRGPARAQALRARPPRRDPRPAGPEVRLRPPPRSRIARTSSTPTARSPDARRSTARATPRAIGASCSYANSGCSRWSTAILESDPNAVIMLQADEGPFPARYAADEWGFEWRDATDAELEEKFGILFAMRVPGADLEAEGFHDAITPVNAFRIIFNARFGTDLPLLPDRTLGARGPLPLLRLLRDHRPPARAERRRGRSRGQHRPLGERDRQAAGRRDAVVEGAQRIGVR